MINKSRFADLSGFIECRSTPINHPFTALIHAENEIKGRWEEGEPLILTSPFCSYVYAKSVLKKPWKEAEKIILTDARCAYLYAKNVIKGRWKEAEKIIAASPWRKAYELNIIVNQDIVTVVSYVVARKHLSDELRSLILANPEASYRYAKNVIRGRWKEGEPIILTSPQWACAYALYVMKGRWEAAEEIIFSDDYTEHLYRSNVID